MNQPTTTLHVDFVSESAGYRNTFGWYNKATGVGGILFANVEADGRNAPLDPGSSSTEFVVSVADLGNIEYFLIPDGAGNNYSRELSGPIKVIQLPNGSWAVARADADGNVVMKNGKPDILEGDGANAFFTEKSRNEGGIDHASSTVGKNQTTAMLVGDSADGPTGLIAWEDLAATNKNGVWSKPGDADYNDAVFRISVKNGRPDARNDNVTVSEDASATPINVLANDGDPDGDTVKVVSVAGGDVLGVVTVAPDGSGIIFNPGEAYQYLGAGEGKIETFSYKISDGNGGTDTATVSVKITGANDGPAVTNADASRSATELADGALGENAVSHTVLGEIKFEDADRNDSHTVAATAQGTGYVGTFTVSLQSDDDDHANRNGRGRDSHGSGNDCGPGDTDSDISSGAVTLTFTVPDAAIDFLSAGQVLLQHYNVLISDGHGGTVTQVATVKLTGTNDRPKIDAVVTTGAVSELTDNAPDENTAIHTRTGNIDFSDVDLADGHTLTVVPHDSGYRGSLVTAFDDSATGDGHGRITWTYSVGDADLDDLAAGNTLTQNYTVTISDGQGGTVEKTVSIVIEGADDAPDGDNLAPVITSGPQTSPVSETADNGAGENTGIQGVTGAITFGDGNAGDTHTASVTPQATGYRGTFALDPVNQSADSVGWTFSIADIDVDDLAEGQELTQQYVVIIDDGHAGTATQTVTITITGANDVPEIGGTIAASVQEDVDVSDGNLSTGGTLTITDADAGQSTFMAQAVTVGSNGYGTFTLDASGNWTYAAENAQGVIQGLAANQVLVDSFTAVSLDGTANKIVTVTIGGSDDGAAGTPPETADTNNAGGEDYLTSIFLSATDLDGDQDIAGFRILSLPQGGQLLNFFEMDPVTGEYSPLDIGDIVPFYDIGSSWAGFQPDENWSGVTTFAYAAIDLSGEEDNTPATATITIHPIGDEVIIEGNGQPAVVGENQPIVIPARFTLEDGDGSEQLDEVSVYMPAGFTMEVGARSNPADPSSAWIISRSQGHTEIAFLAALIEVPEASQLVLTPPPNWDQDFYVSVTARNSEISDGSQGYSYGASFFVDINAANENPDAIDALLTTSEDASVAGILHANDADNDTFVFSLVASSPHGGTVSSFSPTTGSFVFKPDNDFSGMASFQFAVDDGKGGTDIGNITIDVAPKADQPLLTLQGNVSPIGLVNAGTGTGGGHDQPSIAAIAGGGWLVAWSGETDNTFTGDIYFRVYDANGVGGAPVLANPGAALAGGEFSPQVAGLADGGWIVTWYGGNSGFNIHQHRYDSTGASVGGGVSQVNATVPGQFQTVVKVASLPDGGWVVVWNRDGLDVSGDVYLQRFHTDGNGGAEQLVNDDGFQAGIQSLTNVTGLDDGGWIVSWGGNGPSGTGIYSKHFDANGTAIETEYAGASQSSRFTQLADGGMVETWSAADGSSGYDIYQRYYDADGTPNIAVKVNTGNEIGNQILPVVAPLEDGSWVVAWTSNNVTDIYQRHFNTPHVAGNEDSAIALPDISASVTDLTTGVANGGLESLALRIEGIPEGAILTDGNETFTATASIETADISGWNLSGLSLMPPPDFNGSFTLRVRAEVTDTAQTSTGIVFDAATFGTPITVDVGTNRAPVAMADGNDSDAVIETGVKPDNTPFPGDASANGNVLTNDTDADASDTRTVSAVNGVAGNVGTLVTGIYGTLTLAANGVWTYALNNAASDTNALAQGNAAQDVFNYTMRDTAGATSSSTLSIAITGSNDAPILALPIADQSATEDAPFSFTLAESTFADADLDDSVTLSATLENGDPLPAWLTFNPATGAFSGTPLDGDVGEVDVRMTATDGSNATASGIFKLSIAGTNTSPADFSLQNIPESLPEDTATNSRIKVADIAYQDDAQGTETFVLAGPDSDFFEIEGTEVFLKAGATLDFELDPTLFLNIDVFDTDLSSAPLASVSAPIRISDVRDGPSVNMRFVRTEFADGVTTSAPATVADFSVRDDALGSHIATLSGPDAALFTLVDQSFGQFYQVKLNPGVTLDADDPPLSVTVSIDDPGIGNGAEFQQTVLLHAIKPEPNEFTGILFGTNWPSDFITYSFDLTFDASLVLSPAPGLRALDETQKDVARAAFQQWTESSGVNFIEAPDGLGLVHVGVAGLPTNLFGFAFFPPDPGTIVIDDDLAHFDTLTWLHEIGHTLGLKHSFEQPAIDRTFDSTDFTVMSYTVGTNVSQLGLFDIQAAQFLYGAEDDAVWSWDIDTLTLTQTSDVGAQELKGIAFTDVMSAGAEDDTLSGFDGDDTLAGGGGNDALNGGTGIRDVAVYSGNRDDYSLTLDAEGRGIMVDLRPGAPDGTDMLEGIERIRFADGEFGFLRLADPSGNEAPVARDDRDFGDFYLIDEDSTLAIGTTDGVLVNDNDPDFDLLTAVLVTGPAHGDVVLNQDGAFVYTPDADFFGADSFTYRTSDGLLESATATVAIFVNATDDPVIAADYSLAVNEDGFITLPAGNNGATSADSQDVFIETIAADPQHGQIAFDFEAGLYRYTPDANFNGVDSATVFLNDGLGDPTPQVLSFNVAPVNDAPVFGGEVLQSFVGEGIAENGVPAVTPVDSGDGLWRLTPDSPDVAGAIWDEVNLSQNWTWTTEITLGFNGAAGGDGLAFVLQSQGESALTNLDATEPGYHTGDSLGIGSGAGVHGLPGAFGIHIDTTLPPLPPPLQNLGLNSISFFQNDALGVSQLPEGSGPVTTTALDAGFGAPLGLVISWESATATLSYVLTTPNGDITGSQVFDPDTLPPGQAYFGFTAATSGATNEQLARVLSVVSETETISLSTTEDTAISGSVTATDIDGDSFKFLVPDSGGGAPTHGSVAIDTDTGAFTYTPDLDFIGSDTFLINVDDGNGGIDLVTINIGVHPLNNDLLLI